MKTLCIVLLSSVAAAAQSAPRASVEAQASPSTPTTTLHAKVTAVVVDVVVTDKEHHPVHGLKQSNFRLTEDKNAQTIASFEEHVAQARPAPMPKLAPGVFTNYTAAPLNSAVNILLIDTLNTPLADQAYMHEQILKYVNSPLPANNVAIFGLSTRLRMLQAFSSNPELLKAVVNKQLGKASPLLADEIGASGVSDSVTDIMSEPAQSLMPADVVAAMQTLEDSNQSLSEMIRAKYTLDAMNQLARYLASIPGRKNLIWFSGSFPVNILPSAVPTGADDHFASVADSEPEYRETAELLARSQVAVYPIDARGMITSPTTQAGSSGSRYASRTGNFNKDELNFFSQTASEHGTMARMAEDTGGRAFYNTNGLAQAVSEAIQDGSSYYTLTYSPTNTRQSGDFRKIEVKLAQQGYTLDYRRGYFADDPDHPSSDAGRAAHRDAASASRNAPPSSVNAIQKQMLHGVPGATQILIKVVIQPSSASTEEASAPRNVMNAPGFAVARPPFRRFQIAFAAAPQDITFTTLADGMRQATVQFVSIVYAADGALVTTQTDTVTARLTAADYAALLHGGLRFNQEISVPEKGEYSIRAGVLDMASNRLGSLETSVALVKDLPAVAISAAASH
jgi:VWFA-related protein